MIKNLLQIVKTLRERCPWDKQQSLNSIKNLFIEESYELQDAIESKDSSKIEEELGDILFLVAFASKIAEEKKATSFKKIVDRVSQKLKEKHPHVFGNKKIKTKEEVLYYWEELKEKKQFFEGIPRKLPSLTKAILIQERVKRVGFDWEDKKGPLQKIKEELEELERGVNENQKMEEIGDLLFAVVNLARWLGIDPEEALQKTNKKFMQRFEKIVETSKKSGKKLKDMSLDEMDKLWEEIKAKEKKK